MQLETVQTARYRQSILAFDTLRTNLRISGWAIWLALFLIVGEVLLRIPAVQAYLPPPEPTLWHTRLIQPKLDYLKAFQKSHGIDLLFMGNSTTQAGFNPQLFDQNRPLQGTEGSFNGAIEGLPPFGNFMFLEIYLRYTQPQYIVFGMTPQDLNSNSPWAEDITDRVDHSPLALAESRTGIRGHVLNFFLSNSMLFRYRFVLHQLLLSGGFPEPIDVYFDQRGYHDLQDVLADVPQSERTKYLNKAGVLNYSSKGIQIDSMRKILQLAKAENIHVALVNLPLADDYDSNFDDLSAKDEYLTALQGLASEFNLPLWDMENLPADQQFTDSDFGDFNHLNEQGAARLTQMVSTLFSQWIAEKGK